MTKLRQNKDVRVFIWTVFNSWVTLAISYMAGLTGENAVMVSAIGIPFLNIVTKYINVRLFGDLWVDGQGS